MHHHLADFAAVPPIPVLLAALAILLVGSAWYSRRLFGRAWMRHTGIRSTDIRPHEARRGYIWSTIAALVTAYLIGLVSLHTRGNPAALFGTVVFIWLFVKFEILNGFIWRREPFALFVLQSFRSLFSLLAAALVFYLWSMV